MLSFGNQSHIAARFVLPAVCFFSVDVFNRHNVKSEELFSLRGSCGVYGLHAVSLVFTVVPLSHSQICILHRILKLEQCRIRKTPTQLCEQLCDISVLNF